MHHQQRLAERRDPLGPADALRDPRASRAGCGIGARPALPPPRRRAGSASIAPVNSRRTWTGLDGAPIVTTPVASGMRSRGREHRGAAEAVPDQERRRAERARAGGRPRGRGPRGWRRSRCSRTPRRCGRDREVEAQHAEAPRAQARARCGTRREVLGAGEAVREQRGGADRADGMVVARVERCAERPGEGESGGLNHRGSLMTSDSLDGTADRVAPEDQRFVPMIAFATKAVTMPNGRFTSSR